MTTSAPAAVRSSVNPADPKPPLPTKTLRRRIVLLVVSVAIVLGAAAWVLLGSSWFDVQEVTASGQGAGPDAIVAAAAIDQGTPLILLDTAEIGRRVGTIPEVASVDVEVQWPHTVAVTVHPRTAVGHLQDQGTVAAIDGSGTVFARGSAPVDATPNVDVPESDRLAVAAALAAMTPEVRARIETVTVDGGSPMLTLRDSAGAVRWGGATDNEEKAKVLAILLFAAAAAQSDDNEETAAPTWFDLSAPGLPVTAKERPGAPAAASPGATPSAAGSSSDGSSSAGGETPLGKVSAAEQ